MNITAAANTVVPAILVLEQLGFTLRVENNGELLVATRQGETYSAEDPVTVLGLVKLIEVRGAEWKPTDAQVDATLEKYNLS